MKQKTDTKFCRRKDCIKTFCNDLKELVTVIISYKEERKVERNFNVTLH